MGNVVCNCMVVDEAEILEAIRNKKATTLKAVGKLTGAGTGCGRCTKIIQHMITEHACIDSKHTSK